MCPSLAFSTQRAIFYGCGPQINLQRNYIIPFLSHSLVSAEEVCISETFSHNQQFVACVPVIQKLALLSFSSFWPSFESLEKEVKLILIRTQICEDGREGIDAETVCFLILLLPLDNQELNIKYKESEETKFIFKK